jgi:hypothetical protein
MRLHSALRLIVIAVLLGAVAWVAQSPASSDSDVYQQIGRHGVVLDCHDVHCYRVLVAIVLEHLPGPSIVKWKAYAVLTDAAAALAIGRLCVVLGMSVRLAVLATWIAAVGFGPLQAVFDPYTSDPVMYLLGPLMMAELLEDRVARATLAGSIGVLAKEFAAVPLWMFALLMSVQRRWDAAMRALVGAMTATLVWLTLQTALMTIDNYSYGGNPSVNLLGGGYFAVWVDAIGWTRAVAHLFTAYGPLYLLFAAGLLYCGRTLQQLALCSIPPLLAFAYVQQPDRSLCNFQFVVIPIAVLMLDALPNWLCTAFIVSFGIANLRLGEPQPAAFLNLRLVMLAASMVIAAYSVAETMKQRRMETAAGGVRRRLD